MVAEVIEEEETAERAVAMEVLVRLKTYLLDGDLGGIRSQSSLDRFYPLNMPAYSPFLSNIDQLLSSPPGPITLNNNNTINLGYPITRHSRPSLPRFNNNLSLLLLGHGSAHLLLPNNKVNQLLSQNFFSSMSLNDPSNNGWYMDTGATSHLYSEAGILMFLVLLFQSVMDLKLL